MKYDVIMFSLVMLWTIIICISIALVPMSEVKGAGTCPVTKIEGADKYGWTELDKKTLKRAKQRCKELYPQSPCVKIFRKTSKQDYQVVCGK